MISCRDDKQKIRSEYEKGHWNNPVLFLHCCGRMEVRQCCGSTEIELGTVYAAEMGITIFSDIDRYTLEDAQLSLSYHLKLLDGSEGDVPMEIFEVSEANRLIKCLEIKVYDYMLRFDKSFNGFETVGTAWDFINLCCKTCKVDPEQSEDEIKAMPNGSRC